jgi:hypothetical protein
MTINHTSFYSVKEDLSVIKFDSFEEAVEQEDFLYCIRETTGTDPNTVESNVRAGNVTFNNHYTEIQLLDKNGNPYYIKENKWTTNSPNITYKENDFSKVIPIIEVVSPFKHVLTLTSSQGYYIGIIELHKLIRQLSKLRFFDVTML